MNCKEPDASAEAITISRLNDWYAGRLRIRSVAFVDPPIAGPWVPRQIAAFGCLYPRSRRLRVHSLRGSWRTELQERIAAFELPAEAERAHQRRLADAGLSPEREALWSVAEVLADIEDLPLGFYGVEHVSGRRPRGVLTIMRLLPPREFLERLQAAASS